MLYRYVLLIAFLLLVCNTQAQLTFGMQAGYRQPLGELNEGFKPGVGLDFKMRYWNEGRFGFGAQFGYGRMKSAVADSMILNLLPVEVVGELYFRRAGEPLRPYIGATAGLGFAALRINRVPQAVTEVDYLPMVGAVGGIKYKVNDTYTFDVHLSYQTAFATGAERYGYQMHILGLHFGILIDLEKVPDYDEE